jgi:hypothetical protein
MKIGLIILASVLLFLVLTANLIYAMTIVINIPEKYSEVSPGEKVYFETEVKWPENTQRKDLRIEYTIKDRDSKTISYLKVLKAIETQASFMDSISIPESTKPGTYTIFLNVTDYGKLNQEVAASFNIVNKPIDLYKIYFFVAFVVICIMAVLMVIELFILIKKKG